MPLDWIKPFPYFVRRKRKMKARFAKLLGLLIVASMLFTACAPKATPTPQPPVTTGGIDCKGAKAGDEIGLKVNQRVREGYSVYRV